jgi:hypothetical protein
MPDGSRIASGNYAERGGGMNATYATRQSYERARFSAQGNAAQRQNRVWGFRNNLS